MKTIQKTIYAAIFAVMCHTLLFAQVKSDFDKEADFTKYKTYKFLGWEENSDQILNDFDKKRLLESFQKELTARGMTKDESNPDVGITLFIVVQQKTSTTAYTNYNGGMGYGYGRWGGWGAGYGMGSSTTTYSQDDYLEGTIVIDFYDESTKKLVWQGILTKEVVENPKKREKTIPKAVNKLMYQYPVKPAKKK
jgi:hypothetical protein